MLCLCYTITLPAQELSGTWRGYFIPNNEQEGRVYNYEVEIQENQSHQLTVITYTSSSGNSSSNFSAKALGNGFHSVNTNLVSIVETKFDGLNLASNQQACLMTNYLTYSNNRGRISLEGTYISNNTKGTRDCGGGKIFLEKEISLEKVKAANIVKVNNQTNANTTSSESTKTLVKKESFKNKGTSLSTKIIVPATINNNNNNNNTARQSTDKDATIKEDVKAGFVKEVDLKESKNLNEKADDASAEVEETSNQQSLPWVLVGRENVLIKKLNTSSKNLSIDLYDNGTIDNDTINIYDNKSLLSNKQRCRDSSFGTRNRRLWC